MSYWPCDVTGEGEPDDELIVDEPSELLNKEIFFRVEVDAIENLPADLCKNVFVTYIFKHEPETIHRVPTCEGKTQNPSFGYKKVHRVDCITEYMLDYFNTGNVSRIVEVT